MPKLYGSVNNESKQIVKLYGPVSGTSKEIVKLYGAIPKEVYDVSPDGTVVTAIDADALLAAFKNNFPNYYNLNIVSATFEVVSYTSYYSSSAKIILNISGGSPSTLTLAGTYYIAENNYGVTFSSTTTGDTATVPCSYSPTSAKLIYEKPTT